MRWLLRIVGVVLTLLGTLWVLQGINVVRTGFMAGHIQYAFLGIVAAIIGIGLIALASWQRKGEASASGPGTGR